MRHLFCTLFFVCLLTLHRLDAFPAVIGVPGALFRGYPTSSAAMHAWDAALAYDDGEDNVIRQLYLAP